MANQNTMSKPHDYSILLAGLFGILLGVLVARPKRIPEAILALLAGVFCCLVVGPAVAELCTRYLTNASTDTSLYILIIGMSGLLGQQIVLAFKEDFLNWIRRQAGRKINGG